MVIVVSAFFVGAQHHFSTIDLGIKNSKLRKQLDDLQQEKRRLIVARETSLTPVEIRKAAHKLGMTGDGQIMAAALPMAQPSGTASAVKISAKANTATVSQPMVAKTAFTRPVTAPAVDRQHGH